MACFWAFFMAGGMWAELNPQPHLKFDSEILQGGKKMKNEKFEE